MKYLLLFTCMLSLAAGCDDDIKPLYDFPKLCDEAENCECPEGSTDCGDPNECFNLQENPFHCGGCNQPVDGNASGCVDGVILCGNQAPCAQGELCVDEICEPEPTPVCGPRANDAQCPTGEVCRDESGQCEPEEQGGGQGQ